MSAFGTSSSGSEERKVSFQNVGEKTAKEFRNYLTSLGLSARSINAILSACKSFYDFLIEEGKVKGNPFASKKLRVSEAKRQPDFLNSEELEKSFICIQ